MSRVLSLVKRHWLVAGYVAGAAYVYASNRQNGITLTQTALWPLHISGLGLV